MSRRGENSGFSLIEVLVVVAIMLIVTAISIPSLMTSYRGYRMGAALRDTANLISRTRFESVRRNAVLHTLFFADARGNQWYGIDLNNSGQLDADEPRIIVPEAITMQPPPNVQAAMWNATPTMGAGYLQANMDIPDGSMNPMGAATGRLYSVTFSERGTSFTCGVRSPRGGGGCAVTPIAVLFLADQYGNWGAITINQMGTIQSWRATGAQPIYRRP